MSRSAPASTSSARRTPARVPPSSRTTNSGSTCRSARRTPRLPRTSATACCRPAPARRPWNVYRPESETTPPTSTRPSSTLTPSGLCAAQRVPGPRDHGATSTPGLRIPRGSRASLIERIAARSPGRAERSSAARLAIPMPCSALDAASHRRDQAQNGVVNLGNRPAADPGH